MNHARRYCCKSDTKNANARPAHYGTDPYAFHPSAYADVHRGADDARRMRAEFEADRQAVLDATAEVVNAAGADDE